MATQAEVDALVAQLATVSSNVDGISSDLTELKRLLEKANQNPAVDLSAAIAAVDALVTKTSAIDAEFPAPTV